MRWLCALALASLGIGSAHAHSIATGPFYLSYDGDALQPESDHAIDVVDDVVGLVPDVLVYACALDATHEQARQRLGLLSARLTSTVKGRAVVHVDAQCPDPVIASAPGNVEETSLVLWIDLSAAEKARTDAL
ncbi:hypothetical protein AAG596_03985 [Citromicrobium bathyomarinum]|uniref:hypothetical protein n=1 Tax=Citromicrobium TaxID=72173 RepID=UPI000225DEAD|nr:hypothetical protein [Citromicrobium sp. JLT1363]